MAHMAASARVHASDTLRCMPRASQSSQAKDRRVAGGVVLEQTRHTSDKAAFNESSRSGGRKSPSAAELTAEEGCQKRVSALLHFLLEPDEPVDLRKGMT